MLPLTLLPLNAPRIDGDATRTLDLAALTVHQARQLNGRSVRVTFTASTLADGPIVEAEGPEDESRTVHFVEGTPPTIGERVVVECELRVVRHAARVHDWETFPGSVEVRVVGARLVR